MRRLAIMSVLGSVLMAASAQAGLDGTQVTVNYNVTGLTGTADVVTVGPGVELTCTGGGTGNGNICSMLTGGIQTVDIGDNSIHYTYTGSGGGFNPVATNGFDFTGLDAGGTINGYTLTTDIPGLDGSRISFTGSTFDVYMGALVVAPTAFFDVVFDVPEPGGMALVLAGLGGMAAVRRGRKRFFFFVKKKQKNVRACGCGTGLQVITLFLRRRQSSFDLGAILRAAMA